MLESFFIYGTFPPNVEKGVYQLPLVILSYMVASFASYTALALAQQLVRAINIHEKRLFHWGGAFAMGAGIWSMHFIGMLSYKMLMVVEYDVLLTTISLLIAIAVAYGVLAIVTREHMSMQQVSIGAVLLGFGICSMHYTGMAAMKMDGDLRYIPSIFFLSVVIAITASAAALWMAFTLARHGGKYRYLFQIVAALIMGAGICGMHYTGMWASVIIPYADCRFTPDQNFAMLAISIAAITSIILGLALAVGIYRKTQMEFQLENSESKLRNMIDNALDAVITMDQQGLVTEWNKQAETIFGWSQEEAIGKNLTEMIIPPEYREAHNQGMRRFLLQGIAPLLNRRIELSALNRRNQCFPIELAVTAQKLLDDTYQFTAFLRDITASKEAEARMLHYTKELERSNQELDDFAYIASHDLKEPLRGLHNHASFLLEDYQDKLDKEGIHRLHRLQYLTKRMESLISDLMYFSRLGRVELAIQETAPDEIVMEIQQMMESFMKEHNAHIFIPHPMPRIICDRPRITEVFRNLITNAVKYNDKPEPLVEVGFLDQVDTPHGTERNVFYVRDNGIGIAPQFHEAIFRIFKKLQRPANETETGTGVGLTFVKKIIERHDGHIWLESIPDEGTTFYFNLNRSKNTPEHPAQK